MRVRLLVEDAPTTDKRVIKAGAAEFPTVLRVASSGGLTAQTAGLLLNVRREGSFVLGDYDHDLPPGKCITVAANDYEGTLEDGEMVFARYPVRGATLTPIDDWPWPSFAPFEPPEQLPTVDRPSTLAAGAVVNCRNHPGIAATHKAAMPSPSRRTDGSYQDDVPLCAECAPRIERLGWAIVPLASTFPTLANPAELLASMQGLAEAALSGLAGIVRPHMLAEIRAVLEQNEGIVDQRPEALDHLANALADLVMPTGLFDGPDGD